MWHSQEMDQQYPIGRFSWPASLTTEQRQEVLQHIEMLPLAMREAVAGLNEDQLDTPYREGGWTVRQVVHHVADSHMHSYIRCKFAVNEDKPLIKPYDEGFWADYEDGAHAPINVSLAILDGLHARWANWFRSLNDTQWERAFVHPENGPMRLDITAGLYAWHGRHHTAHIIHLREHQGW